MYLEAAVDTRRSYKKMEGQDVWCACYLAKFKPLIDKIGGCMHYIGIVLKVFALPGPLTLRNEISSHNER